jgi:hypothetical protein
MNVRGSLIIFTNNNTKQVNFLYNRIIVFLRSTTVSFLQGSNAFVWEHIQMDYSWLREGDMKRKTVVLFVVLMFAFVLTACSAPPAPTPEPPAEPPPTELPPPTEPPAPTEPPPPTDTPQPTATPEPENTPLPEGVLFRDEFNGSLQPEWEWMNENPEKWSISDDGWFQIIGEPPSLLGGEDQMNMLWLDLPEGDFMITAHLKTKPYANFHQSTIYVYEGPENFVAINRGYCDICDTAGGGFYMEYKIDGAWGAYNQKSDDEDVYLRLVSQDNMIIGYYATTEGDWIRLGRFGNFFQFKRVGIGVTNVGTEEAVVGAYDWFEISEP